MGFTSILAGLDGRNHAMGFTFFVATVFDMGWVT
jgi:hypothetical protein